MLQSEPLNHLLQSILYLNNIYNIIHLPFLAFPSRDIILFSFESSFVKISLTKNKIYFIIRITLRFITYNINSYLRAEYEAAATPEMV